jgi:hypothetical protein
VSWFDKTSWKNRYTKLLQWEYWPIWTFYFPNIFYYLWSALMERHMVFFTAANPGLFTGGSGMESKYTTIMMLPSDLRPKTVLAKAGQDFSVVKEDMEKEGLTYPVIAKPDIGYRGMLVKKVSNDTQLKNYLNKYDLDFLVQEFIDLPKEGGVHYHRFPGEATGHITSVTLKEYLSVTGDGKSTVLELVKNYDRALLQIKRLRENYPEILNKIPEKGAIVPLGNIGNHSKGTRFINGNHLIDEAMVAAFQNIVDHMEGVHYGRFDLKCYDYEEMKLAKNIKVIELNGIGAEPTHIYDPTKMSYFEAVLTITRHWRVIRKLSKTNHKLGVPYMKFKTMLKHLENHRQYVKKINRINTS